MLGVLEKDPSHPFGKLPILSGPPPRGTEDSLSNTQAQHTVPTTTGIPPHLAHLHNITTIKGCCKDIKVAILEFRGELRETVSHVINSEVEESVGINVSILVSWIQSLRQRLVNHIEQIEFAPLLNIPVEESCMDASAASVVTKANEFFTGLKFF